MHQARRQAAAFTKMSCKGARPRWAHVLAVAAAMSAAAAAKPAAFAAPTLAAVEQVAAPLVASAAQAAAAPRPAGATNRSREALAADAVARRPIAETDLFGFIWVADPQISPDGKRVAFVRVTVDAKREDYETAIWIVAADRAGAAAATDRADPAAAADRADPAARGARGDPAMAANPAATSADAGPRPLTAGPYDEAPRWSPDGRRLAFVRRSGKEGQLFVLPLDGGEARQATSLPGGASSPAWSPDGKSLAFLSSTSAADLAKAAKKAGQEPARKTVTDGGAALTAGPADAEPEHESDVRVITRAVYRANGAGYLDFTHPDHLWVVEVPAGGGEAPPARQLTRGEFDEQAPVWAPDGSRLYVVSEREKEPYYEEAGEAIYTVPAGGGELVKVAGLRGGISSLAVSPDGSEIAFMGASQAKPVRSYDQPDLWVVGAAPGSEPRNLTASFDADIGAHLIGDQRTPRGSGRDAPVWGAGGHWLLVPVEERGRVDLRRFDVASGRSELVTSGDHEVVSYAATLDGRRLALVISTPVEIGDLFVLDDPTAVAAGRSGAFGVGGGDAGSAKPPRQLTHFNAPLLARLNLTLPEEITYRSFDGREIEAWVQKPPGFQPGKRYPLILDIHGGPHAAYGYTFFHEAQWMAAKGYVVLCANPRGSTSYGQDFGNVIQYHFPGDDFKDLMAGVDELLRRGDLDPKRLGVTGGSGGGLLTNWTITQTDRFAAAVSQRSIADWAGWWYTADFTLFTPRWFRGAPFQDPQEFAARSPITGIDKVKTPLMLIEGEADYRTPPAAGGEAMFRALKYLRRPVAMVRFPGESHELSRSGRPWHRVERLQHIVRWFGKYLKGEKTDLYDVP